MKKFQPVFSNILWSCIIDIDNTGHGVQAVVEFLNQAHLKILNNLS